MDKLSTGVSLIGETLSRLFYLLPSTPAEVQIEITNKCNLECLMCPRKVLGVPLEHMPFDKFQAIIERIAGANQVILVGWGEPFLHPNIYPMIELCKAKGFYTRLTTNGLALKANASRIIEAGLDGITFSVDSIKGDATPGHLNREARKLIEELAGLRRGKRPWITLQAVLHKGRAQDIYDVISYGAEVGADRINLGRLDYRFTPVKRPSLEEERAIFTEADELGKQLDIQVDMIHHGISTGLNRFLYKFLKGSLHQFGRYCLKTYNYLYINIRGEVTPCCLLPNYAVGYIINQELKQIWQGERFKYFRKNMDEICMRCDQWKIKYIEPQEVSPEHPQK